MFSVCSDLVAPQKKAPTAAEQGATIFSLPPGHTGAHCGEGGAFEIY